MGPSPRYLDDIEVEEYLPIDGLGDDGIRTRDLAVTGRNLYLCANLALWYVNVVSFCLVSFCNHHLEQKRMQSFAYCLFHFVRIQIILIVK